MGGAGHLAGGGAGGNHVLPVLPVVGIPGVLGQQRLGELGVLGGGDVHGGAELLAQLQGVGGTDLHALGAGHALGLVHLRLEVGADGVPGAEHQTHAQTEAGAGAAVADGGAVAHLFDVGDVVHEAVVLGALDDLQRLFLGDPAGTAGADVVLRAFAHLDAHLLGQVAAAVADGGAGGAAGAGRHGEGVILVQIVAELLIGADAGEILDGALHGDNAHQAVAVGDQGGHGLHADAGVLLEGLAHLGMGVQQLLVVHQHLHDAGGEDLHEVHVFSQLLIVGAAEDADPGQVLGQLLHLFHGLADLLGQVAHGALLAETGGDGNIGLIVGDDAGQGIILGGVLVDLVHNAGEAADDMTELDDFRSQFSHDMILSLNMFFCSEPENVRLQ